MKAKAVIVSSVKGGTGKTLFSLNLAKRLSTMGKTGLVDADVDSSNFSEFTGSNGKMEINEIKKTLIPYSWDGVEVFSMSLLTDGDEAVSMTGDRYSTILRDAILNTEWSQLQYMVLDLPSGASDIFKEIIYLLGDDLVGGIIVVIPSCVVDARRVIKLHLLNEIPVLGIVENMSWFECDECGKKYEIFGPSMAQSLAKEFDVPFLGRIPLSSEIVANIRRGNPIISDKFSDPIIRAAEKVKLSKKAGLLTRLRTGLKDMVAGEIEKLIATIVVTVNKTVNILEIQNKYGYKEKKVFEFIITNRSREKPITRVKMKVDEGKLVLIENPKIKPAYSIVTDIPTIARVAWGVKKVNGKFIPYNSLKAWLNGDIRLYGEGTTARAVEIARKMFNDETIIRLRDKFPILKRFV